MSACAQIFREFAEAVDALFKMRFRDRPAAGWAGVGAKCVTTQRQAGVDPFPVILNALFSFVFVRRGKVAVPVHRDVEQPYAGVVRPLTKFVKISVGQSTSGRVMRIVVHKEGAVEFQQANVECFNGQSGKVQQTQWVLGIPEPPVNAPARERDFHGVASVVGSGLRLLLR